jgi:hypothetical protein
MFPISHVLFKNKQGGYKIHENKNLEVDHLLYMDDIKLYCQCENKMTEMVHTLNEFSQGIRMEFNASKCNTMAIKKGMPYMCSPIPISDGEMIHNLNNTNGKYKYLGIWEANDIKHEEMKEEIKREYRKRVRVVLKSKLNGPNKINAINQYAVPIIRYSAGIIKWRKNEISQLDIGTRKLLTLYRCFARKDDVDRLYVKRLEGGRGLLNIEDAIKSEIQNMVDYISRSKSTILRACMLKIRKQ